MPQIEFGTPQVVPSCFYHIVYFLLSLLTWKVNSIMDTSYQVLHITESDILFFMHFLEIVSKVANIKTVYLQKKQFLRMNHYLFPSIFTSQMEINFHGHCSKTNSLKRVFHATKVVLVHVVLCLVGFCVAEMFRLGFFVGIS
eukprot:TRINITY_DN4590_c0_g1_i1.p1 TRINITY_DN4590_c0_g1~~TRINITY_DN4590_c0_g1_i1.p1  ORF type:complete len:142 (-),score=17.89 TRINITY_DN4590_c0_g1_i1:229-654(-)